MVQKARHLHAVSVRGNWDEDGLKARQLQQHSEPVPVDTPPISCCCTALFSMHTFNQQSLGQLMRWASLDVERPQTVQGTLKFDVAVA